MSVPLLAIVSALNDATMLMQAFTPLYQQAIANGQTEVSDEDVAAARAGLGKSIDLLDAAIADAKQGSLPI
jgi:hypothetical protein